MTKGLRTTVYAAAALTLAALLVLLLMPAQARYLRTAQWQASYAASPSELTSDLLALRDDKAQLLLADWSPTAGEMKTVTFDMTCPAELLQVSTVEETAETQPAEPISVALGAVDKNLQAETQTSYTVSDDVAIITVALKLTAQTVPKSPVAVCMPIHVELAGAADTWFGGKLSFTLCPAAEGGSSAEEPGLFNDEASMTEYDPAQPFYVQYTLPAGCTAAEMKLDDAGFPRGTRFSTDNGISYSVLCEGRPIPVEAGSQSLLVDMSRATTGNGNRTLRLTANGQDGKVFTDTLALTAKSWSGHGAVTYTEDGLPSMQIQPWNSGSLQVTAAVEQLARVEEPVLTEKQENTAQQQPQTTVKYVSADKVVQIEWTTAVEGEDAATEGSSPANAAETQTLTLLPAKDVSRVPAGTYRVMICWKCNDVLIAERVFPFFVTR
ncbi:MAG: hypothetical protein BHV94_06660 [Clostridiales bacterium 59_14]|nr:MAG: hypothetical protein BHV94_06660 [Clostridiales bacterium 59_14]